MRQVSTWTIVKGFDPRSTPSALDPSLWLVAHNDNKFCAVARLRA